MRILGHALLIAFVVIGCGTSASPVPSASPGPALTETELRYRLIDQVGMPEYCDPDSYPVGRDEVPAMRERFPEIERDRAAMTTILRRLGIPDDGSLTDDERLAVYRRWKLLASIQFDGPARAFSIVVRVDPNTGEGTRVTGTAAPDGSIVVTGREPGQQVVCPICLAAGTSIATPSGDVRVEDVRVGMTVWSVDEAGRRIRSAVIIVGRTPVPSTHQVVRLELADGRVVHASPGHPLGDGRLIGSIHAGDVVDGSIVASATLERYDAGFTYDLLTSGPTGSYIADGVVLGSTIAS